MIVVIEASYKVRNWPRLHLQNDAFRHFGSMKDAIAQNLIGRT